MELISATEFGDFIKNETNGLFEFLEVPSEYHKYSSICLEETFSVRLTGVKIGAELMVGSIHRTKNMIIT